MMLFQYLFVICLLNSGLADGPESQGGLFSRIYETFFTKNTTSITNQVRRIFNNGLFSTLSNTFFSKNNTTSVTNVVKGFLNVVSSGFKFIGKAFDIMASVVAPDLQSLNHNADVKHTQIQEATQEITKELNENRQQNTQQARSINYDEENFTQKRTRRRKINTTRQWRTRKPMDMTDMRSLYFKIFRDASVLEEQSNAIPFDYLLNSVTNTSSVKEVDEADYGEENVSNCKYLF